MRRLLGTLALVLSLAGCGEGSGQSPDPGNADVTAALVSSTSGGGEQEAQPTDVTRKADLTAYVAQFDDSLAAKVSEAARRAEGNPVLAQVVSIGCDVPPSAHLEGDTFVAAKVPSPMTECFAPVTTVAVAGVPALQ